MCVAQGVARRRLGDEMATRVKNYEKLFIGSLSPLVEQDDLGRIMMEMGCAKPEVFLVPGLSLFRRMSCLFFYFCFPFCLLV